MPARSLARHGEQRPLRFQRFARVVLRLVAGILCKLEVTGRENEPCRGRLIVMMNHIDGLDPVLVTIALSRDIDIMSKIENLQAPVLGPLTRWFGGFPIRRHELDLSAIRQAVKVLESERALLMAPEGTRSKNASLQPAYDGMALIAARTNAPVLPVAIWGDEAFMANIKRLRRTPVHIRIGEPFLLVSKGESRHREQLRQMTREAMYRLASLLPESYRGFYADLSQATTEFIRPYPTSRER